MTERALIIVTKHAVANGAKTRLCPPLTPQSAASLAECFLDDTLELVRTGLRDVTRVLAVWPPEAAASFAARYPGTRVIGQCGKDLGERLNNAVNTLLMEGYHQVVIMDSDSPTLPPDRLETAFAALDTGADLVIGPCLDGGYYLIGLTHPIPGIFLDVPMSTPEVTSQTLLLVANLGLRAVTLEPWYDVDTPDDLNRLVFDIRNSPLAKAVETRRLLKELNLR